MENANATYSKYRGLKKGETYALDGVILHELYFDNLGGINNMPSGIALELIDQFFGSYENWKQDFIACGKAARGWAVLCYDQRSKSLKNIVIYGFSISKYFFISSIKSNSNIVSE